MKNMYHGIKGRWNRMRGQAEVAALALLFMIAILIGWIVNIVKICNTPSPIVEVPKFVLRCIGILIAPLGAIMGYFVGQ